MNTPRLCRGAGIASSSNVFLYLLYWYFYIVYFVCDSASEFGAMGSTSFLGFSCPHLLLVFVNLLFLGTCIIFFSQALGPSQGLSYFIFNNVKTTTTYINRHAGTPFRQKQNKTFFICSNNRAIDSNATFIVVSHIQRIGR